MKITAYNPNAALPVPPAPPTASGHWHLVMTEKQILASVFTDSEGTERMRFGLLSADSDRATIVPGPFVLTQAVDPAAIYGTFDHLEDDE